MECPACQSEDLHGQITFSMLLPLAKRSKAGSVKVGGKKFDQIAMKTAWETTGPGDQKLIRGPAVCNGCGEDLFLVVGSDNNPYLGLYEQALQVGADHFLAGGTLADAGKDSEGN